MSKRLLIVGSTGQLARAFRQVVPDAIFLDRTHMDLAFPHKVTEALEKHDPRAVINAAAYTQVDKAEKEEQLAANVNAHSPAAMAIFCAGRRIPFVHFSTDYVFDGSGDKPWRVNDIPKPLNAYGRSKLAGEDAIRHIGGRYLILRTSWIYDAAGSNFVNTILRLAAEREELRIIGDQYGAPTYAPHLAAGALAVLEKAMGKCRFPSGIYHLCSQGVTSWYAFAVAITDHARQRKLPLKLRSLQEITADQYPLPAPRPHNSRLDCAKALSMFGVSLPTWQEGLAECMESKK
jgi:dTDP-4-dehydrorhamnose reductase